MTSLDERAGLAGKKAIIVGGAGGIGRTITLALAAAGLDIATCDIDAGAARAIVAEVEACGRKIIAMAVDVCDVEAFERFYDRVEGDMGSVDILVNVAGGARRKLLLETTRDQNAQAIRLNYGYVIDSMRRAIPLFRRGRRGGSVINFTTIEAHRGAAGFAVYAGAKAATSNFSRAMAVELAAEGIRVNVIAPDTTPSRTSMEALDPADMARFLSLSPQTMAEGYKIYIPQKRAPTAEDLANAVIFLASDLSRAITGVTLHVDGGTMASAGFIDWPFGDGFSPSPMPETLSRLFDR